VSGGRFALCAAFSLVRTEREVAPMGSHRTGSTFFAAVLGGSLLVLAYVVIIRGYRPNLGDPTTFKVGIGGSAALFGMVLLWWVAGEGKKWGIGFETITMVVTVVTALVAIIALAD
jgi:hypothetical protein